MQDKLNEETDHNIYEYLTQTQKDDYTLFRRKFILQPCQTIPKYYLFSNTLSSVLLGYSPGVGKTSAAVFAIQNHLENNIYRQFNNLFIKHNLVEEKTKFGLGIEGVVRKKTYHSDIIICGAWQTETQVKKELMNRPEFGYITEEKRNKIRQLMLSPVEKQRIEGELMKHNMELKLNKLMKFVGYQSLFNLIFPNININKYGQNIDALIHEYEQGTLEINENFLESLRNGVIVVDEFQKLYSNLGLNTYGFAVAYLNKQAQKYNYKLLFLTGTMINTSLGEIPDIVNIVSTDERFIKRDEYCYQEIILDNVPVWRLKEEFYEKSMNLLRNHFLFFDPNPTNVKPNLLKIDQVKRKNKNFFFPDDSILNHYDNTMRKHISETVFLKETIQTLEFPFIRLLPQEYHIGNRLISDMDQSSKDGTQPIILYAVKTRDLQNERYKEYLNKKYTHTTSDDDESELSISVHDAFIPETSKYNQYGIYKYGDVLYGNFLSLENIWKFSAIGYEMCCLCFENSFNKEKTIIYHNKINSFGIKQYAAILQYNGFVKYGNFPAKNSICKNCRRRYHDHSLSIQERLKLKICSNFASIFYDVLTGDLTLNEREILNNSVYNNPMNLHGDLISVLFVSDVAYAGVNFLNTHNIFILSRIPNVSKWKQITARIVRTGSHMSLPRDKRYAKIYTFILESEDEKHKRITHGMKYYKKSEILNVDIEKYIKKLSSISISSILFHKPSEYQFKDNERRIANILLQNDIRKNIDNMITRTMVDDTSSIWNVELYIKRLKDPRYCTSFVNMDICSEEFLKNIVLGSDKVVTKRIVIGRIRHYIYLNKEQGIELENRYNMIPYMKFSNIYIKKNSLGKLLETLDKSESYTEKLISLANVLKYVNKDYKSLSDKDGFWLAIFAIHNEYYSDDETNFIFNHCRVNRDLNKIAGFYYGEKIILKDGTVKNIPLSFISIDGDKNHPYIYKITSISSKGIMSANSPFYLHVKLMKNIEKGEDKRKHSSGIACTSMNVKELHKYFPKIDQTLHKKNYCLELLYEVCEMQYKIKNKITYTPFEQN